MTVWSVYVVRCRDGALYTGIATDVDRRLAEHRGTGTKGARYLRGRGPLQLVFRKELGHRGLALKVEDRIKKLSKRRKEQLIGDPDLVGSVVAAASNVPGRTSNTKRSTSDVQGRHAL